MHYSIVMTTYNGEKYIEQQLDSIKQQTLQPREVLIFDDGSTDLTESLILDYISSNTLNWEFHRNEVNLGWKKNFIQGIEKATSECVFLCDQDDIWKSDKCEVMLETLKKYPACNLLMSNYQPFATGANVSIPFPMYLQCNNKKTKKLKLSTKQLLTNYRPGCTYCFRKSFFNDIRDLWEEDMPHDQFLYECGLLTHAAYVLQYKTINFRRHEETNSPKNIRTRKARIKEVSWLKRKATSYLDALPTFSIPNKEEAKIVLSRMQKFLGVREAYYSSPSFKGWVLLVAFHLSDYASVRNVLSDLYIGLLQKQPSDDVL